MALEIVATEEKPITINGTDITIPKVYARLEFAGRIDGKTIEVGLHLFQKKELYLKGIKVGCDVPLDNVIAEAYIIKSEAQDLKTAEKYTKLAYESLGYIVNIVE